VRAVERPQLSGRCRVVGPLDENFYVFDFIALKNGTKQITDELDHLHAAANEEPRDPRRRTGGEVHVRTRIGNGSSRAAIGVLAADRGTPPAECSARYIGHVCSPTLQGKYRFHPDVLRVEVEESIGQFASTNGKRCLMPNGTSGANGHLWADIPSARASGRQECLPHRCPERFFCPPHFVGK